MDDLVRIPCVLMRGGTSKGPFFLSRDLPADPATRDALLVEIMGSGHPLQIDGVGGGSSLSSKVAIVGPATRKGADVDYLFAQVKVLDRCVDTSPNCGNMLSAVGPFAIEAGLVEPQGDETAVKVHNVNTGKIIEAVIQTPGGQVAYDGTSSIDGVPGTAAPVWLAFMEAVGAKTGRLLPSGHVAEEIEGVEVSLIDGATPIVLAQAASFGLRGNETAATLDSDHLFLARLEAIRREAGLRMGLGDVSASVLPKPILVAPPTSGGDLAVRYFTPHACHTALATTGAVTLGVAATLEGSVLQRLLPPLSLPGQLTFEHPTGHLDVRVEWPEGTSDPVVFVMRTSRRLFEGAVLVRRRN